VRGRPGRFADLRAPGRAIVMRSFYGLWTQKDKRVVPGTPPTVSAPAGPAGTAHATLNQPQETPPAAAGRRRPSRARTEPN
jgi:hypothetical protein